MCLVLTRTSKVTCFFAAFLIIEQAQLSNRRGSENTHTGLFGSLLCKICYCPLAKASHIAKPRVRLGDITERYRKINYFSSPLITLLFPFWKFLLPFLLHTYNPPLQPSKKKNLVILLRVVLDTISGFSSIHKFRFFSFPPFLMHRISSYFNIWPHPSS